MRIPAAVTALLLSAVAWTVPGVEPALPASPAPATPRAPTTPPDGLHRCIDGTGVTIFTDRRCDDLQAEEAVAKPVAPAPPGVLVRVRSCARSQDDLLFGVRAALENHDVNRLAEFYHWTGMGNAAGYRLMDRLGSFSERPLVDVQLMSSRTQADDEAADGGLEAREHIPSIADLDAADDPFGVQAPLDPPPPPPRAASDLLRVDQTRSNDDIAALVTYFHLRSNAGCWWMQF
jgi:hypothetical protein